MKYHTRSAGGRIHPSDKRSATHKNQAAPRTARAAQCLRPPVSQQIHRAVLETLEDRQLMSAVTFENGVLTLTGNQDSANRLMVTFNESSNTIWAVATSHSQTVSLDEVTEIKVIGGNEHDFISIDPHLQVPTYIEGRGGNDTILTGGGNDTVYAGGGNDVVNTRGGDNLISGGRGDDTLNGGSGTDTLLGGHGHDTINASPDRNPTPAPSANPTPAPSPIPDPTPQPAPAPAPAPSSGPTPQPTPTPISEPVITPVSDPAPAPAPTPDPVVAPDPTPTPSPTPAPDPGPAPVVIATPDPSAPSPQAVITTLGNGGVGPYTVFVDGLSSNLGVGTDPTTARFDWDFGDHTPDATYNDLTGFNAAHQYLYAGTYTVTLTVTNQAGNQSIAVTTVNVGSDDRRVIYVDSQSGNDANSGLSPDQAIRTIDHAQQFISDGTEVLLHRGQTFDETTGLTIDATDFTLSAYGEGDRPMLNWLGPIDRASSFVNFAPAAHNASVAGITFHVSGHDGDTEKTVVAVRAGGTGITVRYCQFIDVTDGVNCNGNPNGLLVQDNISPGATTLRGFLVWGQGTEHTYVGNVAANSTREHDIRMMGLTRVLIAYNNLTNLDRRSADPLDDAKAAINVQNVDYAYVAHNTIPNGPVNVGPLATPDRASDPVHRAERTRYVVVEDNSLNVLNVLHGAEHVLVQNNVLHSDNIPAVTVDGYNADFDRTVIDARIVHNTAINNGVQGNFLRVNEAGASGIVLDNNLYVAPSLDPGPYGTAVIFVVAGDLSEFTEIANNVWPSLSNINTWAHGSYFRVGNADDESQNFKEPAAWDALPQVHNGQYLNVTLDNGYMVNVNGTSAGANPA